MPGEYSGQKRRREDDGHSHGPNRRPRTNDLFRLRREVVEIGEPSRFKVSQMMHHLGQGLGAIREDEVRTGVMDTIIAVITEQPHKIPLLAGALQIANLDSPIMGQMVVELCHSRLEQYLAAGQYTQVKQFTRLIACLAPIIDGDNVFKFMYALMEKSVDLQKEAGKRSGAAEEVWAGVMLAIPFYLKTGERDGQPDAKLCDHADQLMELQRQFEFKASDQQLAAVSPFVTTSADKLTYQPQQFVTLVRQGLEKLQNELEWRVAKLIDVAGMVRLSDTADQKLHNFPQVNIPSELKNEPTVAYKYPRLYFQAYMPVVFETVPAPGSFEAVIIRDIASDIINGMDFNRKEVARQLITLDLFFSPPTFASPGISFDRLEMVEEGKSTWKVEDVALEAVLDNIFNMPYTLHKPAYYDSILIEACIMAPQAIAPVFGRAIRFLYSNLEVLDVELFHQYLDWFSHHLSNFGFTWKWAEWAEDIGLDQMHPKYVFIKELILKEVRLCYADRVRETLPQEFVNFLPQISENVGLKYLEENTADGEPTGEELPYRDQVAKLMDLLREDKENEESEVEALVNELKDTATNANVGGQADAIDSTVLDVLVQTACFLGSRSLSHAETWVARCAPILIKHINAMDEEETTSESKKELSHARQLDVIKSALDFWKEQPYIGLTVLTYFIRSAIITEWALLEHISSDLSLLVSNHGWNSITRLLDSRNTSDEKRAELLRSLLTKLNTDRQTSENEWTQWWYQNLVRAFARRYHHDLGELKLEGSESQLDQARSLLECC